MCCWFAKADNKQTSCSEPCTPAEHLPHPWAQWAWHPPCPAEPPDERTCASRTSKTWLTSPAHTLSCGTGFKSVMHSWWHHFLNRMQNFKHSWYNMQICSYFWTRSGTLSWISLKSPLPYWHCMAWTSISISKFTRWRHTHSCYTHTRTRHTKPEETVFNLEMRNKTKNNNY